MKKRFLAIVVLLLMAQNMSAQLQLSTEMQKVFEACWALRMAISTGNTAGLKSANEDFKKCKVKDFFTLCPQESDIVSLNGHFVWDEVFVDSLIVGRNVREFAQKYAENRARRGPSGSSRNRVYIKSSAVKKNGKAKFTFPSSNHQELVVITEPQGKISLRVHCKKTKRWYNWR